MVRAWNLTVIKYLKIMSKVTKKILGSARGRVGDVVFRKFRVATVASAYQPTPRDPKTNAQQLVRTRFGALRALAVSFAPIATIGFGTATKGTMLTPRNLFVKRNWKNVTASEPGTAVVDYSELTVAEGSLPSVAFKTPHFDNPNEVEVLWDDVATLGLDAKVYVFAYCQDKGFGILSHYVTAGSGTVTLEVPASWSGLRVELYGVTIWDAADNVNLGYTKGQTAPSAYIGYGTIS